MNTAAQLLDMWKWAWKPLPAQQHPDELYRVLMARMFFILLFGLIGLVVIFIIALTA